MKYKRLEIKREFCPEAEQRKLRAMGTSKKSLREWNHRKNLLPSVT